MWTILKILDEFAKWLLKSLLLVRLFDENMPIGLSVNSANMREVHLSLVLPAWPWGNLSSNTRFWKSVLCDVTVSRRLVTTLSSRCAPGPLGSPDGRLLSVPIPNVWRVQQSLSFYQLKLGGLFFLQEAVNRAAVCSASWSFTEREQNKLNVS